MAAAAGLLALAVAWTPAKADEPGPHAGVSIGGQATRFVNNHVIPNDWYGGANLRFHLGPVFALEGETDYNHLNGNDIYPSQASAIFYLWPHAFAPYVFGGGSWFFENGSSATSSLFGPHAGAGVEFYFERHLALDLNWRYHWVENLNSGSNYFSRSYSTNGTQWRLGLNVYFN